MSMLSDEKRSEIMLSNIDTSDCGVIAIQAVTGLPREEAEQLAVEVAGYVPGTGTPMGGVDRAVRSAGKKVERVELPSGETAATFALMHEYGSHLLYIESHVMSCIDGDLFNARSFWGHPLLRAMRVS